MLISASVLSSGRASRRLASVAADLELVAIHIQLQHLLLFWKNEWRGGKLSKLQDVHDELVVVCELKCEFTHARATLFHTRA